MKAPKILLILKFGRPRKPSRSLDQVVEVYRAALGAGAQATGRWLPSERPGDVAPEVWRDGVLKRWRRSSGELAGAVERWSDRALDRCQVPHPLLGNMTVREILFFSLYHNARHGRRIQQRRG